VTNLTAAGAGRQSAATAGPKGRRPTGLSNVGHRQAPNTKNPRGFADGGFLLPVKNRNALFLKIKNILEYILLKYRV